MEGEDKNGGLFYTMAKIVNLDALMREMGGGGYI